MVVHETYKGPGGWVAPADVIVDEVGGERRARLIHEGSASGTAIQIGAIEKMSKSKKNVVDPDDIIASYGADTARWFMLSDSPPDRDVIWTEAGVEGAHRFVQRVWRLVADTAPLLTGVEARSARSTPAAAISRAAHKALKWVGEDIGRLGFNKAVARIYELVNSLQTPCSQLGAGKAEPEAAPALREALEILVALIAPMMPHLAEECWAALGGEGLAASRRWPIYDPSLVSEADILLPVQINGRKRGDLTIARDADHGAIETAVLALDFVRQALDGRPPRKVIIIPQRIVNVVA